MFEDAHLESAYEDLHYDPSEDAEEFASPANACPACGEYIDYCQGHGELGDPTGFAVLQAHDNGDHSLCVINCEDD